MAKRWAFRLEEHDIDMRIILADTADWFQMNLLLSRSAKTPMLFAFGHFLLTFLRKSLITCCHGSPLSGVCGYPTALMQTWRTSRHLPHHSAAPFLGAHKARDGAFTATQGKAVLLSFFPHSTGRKDVGSLASRVSATCPAGLVQHRSSQQQQ